MQICIYVYLQSNKKRRALRIVSGIHIKTVGEYKKKNNSELFIRSAMCRRECFVYDCAAHNDFNSVDTTGKLIA